MSLLISFFSALPTKLGVSRITDFYWVIASSFCLSAGGGLASTFTNIEVHNLHIFNATLTSIDYTASSLGAFCIYLGFPYLSKLLSLKKLILFSVSICFMGVLFFIPFLKTDINFLIRFCLGGACALFYIAVSCYTSVLFNSPFRATLFGILSVTNTLAYALGSSLISVISTIEYVYLISAGFSAISLVTLIFLSSPKSSMPQKKTASASQNGSSWLVTFLVLPVIFIFCLFYGLGFSGEGKYFPIFAEGLGLIQGKAALLYSFSLLGALVVVPISSYCSDKYGYNKILLIMTIIGALLCVYATFNTSLVTTVILFFLISGIISSFSSLCLAWLSELFTGSPYLPTGMSLRSMLQKLGGIASPLIIGFFMSTYGNVGFVYWITIGFCLCAVILAIAAFRHKMPFVTRPT